jgi:TRAP-type mannitol/chloroaromatic compound transport system permease small subunit
LKSLLQVSGYIDRLNAGIGRGVSWLVLVMVVVGGFNAIARYSGRFIGINLSSNAWLELQWYLFSLIFLLAAADTLRRNAHVRVDVLYGRLSKRRQAMVDIAGIVLFLLPFCIFGLWSSGPTVLASWHVLEVSPDPGGLPRYPIKSALLVCFVLLGLQGFSELFKRIDEVRT